jgi:hypothetical protein
MPVRQSRSLKLLKTAVRLAGYIRTMGVRQVCWLVEAFELRHGHYESRCRQVPIAADGRPIPWYTYPAVEYFRQLDFSGKTIFEFGSGNSSLFWADRAAHVTSVESDPRWHALVERSRRSNQKVLLVEDLEQYPSAIDRTDRQYDLIIVDGKRRFACASAALSHLAEDGMLILDNSDWYPKTATLLRHSGLIQVDFTGLGPVNNYAWTTSLFLTRAVHITPRNGRLPEYGTCSLQQVQDPE